MGSSPSSPANTTQGIEIMGLFKKKIIAPEKLYGTSTWQKLSARFKTIDGEEHYTGNRWKWLKVSGLLCGGGDYIMIDVKSDGYLKDENGVMYPIQNIVSITWQIDCEKTVIAKHSEYALWFSNDEMNKLPVVQ